MKEMNERLKILFIAPLEEGLIEPLMSLSQKSLYTFAHFDILYTVFRSM